jgi:hypothetical protein
MANRRQIYIGGWGWGLFHPEHLNSRQKVPAVLILQNEYADEVEALSVRAITKQLLALSFVTSTQCDSHSLHALESS